MTEDATRGQLAGAMDVSVYIGEGCAMSGNRLKYDGEDLGVSVNVAFNGPGSRSRLTMYFHSVEQLGGFVEGLLLVHQEQALMDGKVGGADD